jgi:four helix bundle protein
MAVKSFRDLVAWQRAMEFTELVYRKTADFPKPEIYGLRAQVRDSASSVPSNIAEGQGRKSTKEFQHFLSIACGSLSEAITQIILSERLKYLTPNDTAELLRKGDEVGRLVNGLYNALRNKSRRSPP